MTLAKVKISVLLALAVLVAGGCSVIDEPVQAEQTHSLSLLMSFKNVLPTSEASTKMSTDVTQYTGNFRGIEHMYAIPFHTETAPVEPEDLRLGTQNVVLGSLGISRTGLVANNNSHLFGSAFVPNGMDRVLVYGKAPDSGSGKESKHIYGSLLPENLSDPSSSDEISFHLEPILETGDVDELSEAEATADNLLDLLNVIMTLMGNSGNAHIVSIYDAVKRENQILSCSYATFNQIRTEIQNALLRTPYESTELLEEIGRVITAITTFSDALTSAGITFPCAYGIPEGAMGFWWNGTAFVRLINDVNIALVDPASYCYPPSLWYYANSPIKTSNTSAPMKEYVQDYSGWSDILAFYTDGRIVDSFTEAVAVEDPLEYGVGMMELTLGTPAADIVSMLNGCSLTGIIIGDQKDVDFKFDPAPGRSRFIYDDNIPSNLKIGTTGTSVQTLVLQTTDNAPVHFALEFKNSSNVTRRCQQGDILPQCKFYLAGVLDPVTDGTQPAGETLSSVFCKDHKTRVSVRIESLKNAYNTVPDLRSPQLEIGIVTEMKWTQVTPQTIVLNF